MVQITYCPPGYAIGYVPQGQSVGDVWVSLELEIKNVADAGFNQEAQLKGAEARDRMGRFNVKRKSV